MLNQADGLAIILRNIKNDVEDMQEDVRALLESRALVFNQREPSRFSQSGGFTDATHSLFTQ